MKISAYESEMSERVREGLRDVLRGLALGDEEKFDQGKEHLRNEIWKVFIWINNRPLPVTVGYVWEIGQTHFFVSNFANRNSQFNSSVNQIGACLLVLSSKLGLTEDEDVMGWIVGLVGQITETEGIVVNTLGKIDRENEKIAIGPTGELAAWIDGKWWLRNGEPVAVDGWTICRV